MVFKNVYLSTFFLLSLIFCFNLSASGDISESNEQRNSRRGAISISPESSCFRDFHAKVLGLLNRGIKKSHTTSKIPLPTVSQIEQLKTLYKTWGNDLEGYRKVFLPNIPEKNFFEELSKSETLTPEQCHQLRLFSSRQALEPIQPKEKKTYPPLPALKNQELEAELDEFFGNIVLPNFSNDLFPREKEQQKFIWVPVDNKGMHRRS